MHPVSFERHLEAGSGCSAVGTEGPGLGRSAERSQAGDGGVWVPALDRRAVPGGSVTFGAGHVSLDAAREALPSPCHAAPLHLRVPCPLLCVPSEGTLAVAPRAGLLPVPELSPAEAGAEASGCPGTGSAAKAPLNRAEQEGALGRRPGAEEVSPRQCPHCPHVPCPEPCSDLAGSGGHLESLCTR